MPKNTKIQAKRQKHRKALKFPKNLQNPATSRKMPKNTYIANSTVNINKIQQTPTKQTKPTIINN